jgi:PAS domain S-box-containing protein
VASESPIWIPAGIGLGVLLVFGWRYWPFIFIGATMGEMGGGHSPFMAMQLAAGAVLSFVVAAVLLERYLKFNAHFETLRDYGLLLIVSLIAAVLSTTINIQLLIWGSFMLPDNVFPAYHKWFIGDFFGLAFVTPVILVLHRPWISIWSKQKIGWFIFSLLGAFLFGQGVFFGWFKELIDLTGRGFFLFFVAAFFGFYFGRHGALSLFALVMLQSIFSSLHGDGYFGEDLLSRPGQQYIWIYLGILCAVGLLISLAVSNFKRQNQALRDASRVAFESAIHFKSIVSEVPILMATYDVTQHKTEYINPYFTKILGYTIEDFVDSELWWLLAYPDPQYRALVQTQWSEHVAQSEAFNSPFKLLETWATCKDGTQRCIAWGFFVVDKRHVIHGQDLTDQKKANSTLEITSALYRAIGDAVVIGDAENRILIANDAYKILTGFEDRDLIGGDFSRFIVKKHDSNVYADIFETLDAIGHWEGLSWIKSKDGTEILKFLSIHSTFDSDGLPLQRVALISEATDQRKARQLINQQANFDPLTGLPNRRLMLDRLDRAIKRATRTKQSLAVIYIDLDNFKDANDSRGHDFGD